SASKIGSNGGPTQPLSRASIAVWRARAMMSCTGSRSCANALTDRFVQRPDPRSLPAEALVMRSTPLVENARNLGGWRRGPKCRDSLSGVSPGLTQVDEAEGHCLTAHLELFGEGADEVLVANVDRPSVEQGLKQMRWH